MLAAAIVLFGIGFLCWYQHRVSILANMVFCRALCPIKYSRPNPPRLISIQIFEILDVWAANGHSWHFSWPQMSSRYQTNPTYAIKRYGFKIHISGIIDSPKCSIFTSSHAHNWDPDTPGSAFLWKWTCGPSTVYRIDFWVEIRAQKA